MSRFKVEERVFGKLPTIKIFDDFYGSSIEIDQMGATLLNFTVRTNRAGLLNLVDGFQTFEEMEAGIGARSWIMAPFTNRIRDNKYSFQGKEYDLSDGNPDLVMHGLVAQEEFQIASLSVEETCVVITLVCEKLKTTKLPGYPFEVEIGVQYIFSGNSLKVKISGKNCDDVAAPFGCGWHPYFKLNDKSIDNLVLTIPAERMVLTDPSFIPFPGEMTYSYLSNLPGSDFRPLVYQKKRMLGKRLINVCYSHLTPNNDGTIVSRLDNPEVGTALLIKQQRGVIYGFTGDESSLRFRYSIAIEPTEFITDAFNRADLADKVILLPGDERVFPIEVEFIQQ